MKSRFAIIGGSGAYHLLQNHSLGKEIESRVIETPFGESAPIHHFSMGDHDFLFLSRHGETDYSLTAPFVNYRANIYALKECAVERIVSWSGPGIIATQFKPGDFVVPHDILDETRRRESTFFKNRGWGFIRQSHPFCPSVAEALHNALHEEGLVHHEQAVYVCTEGPRLESPAEIRKFRLQGADLVGMTLAPETFLARELEMCYASICYLTNYAEGVKEREFKGGTLFEGMMTDEERGQVDASIQRFPALLASAFRHLADNAASCNCPDALRRYKDKGMIGDDWREWMGDV
ncbi:MAG: MTAP family purine nucleoside phosphorylase [Candidatus Nitrohelix vancouverensis]|uniref:Probable 6-oxopurine nucleoside phosphorylase n=1 Tax=Candidatus Nitrohelix vancouverensis TaxID=2705534 RepID=A0A7T0G2Q8_9BACT|nr:MAG: MTAP family purine nucleoside phosphorylase [Candidatus Nitrohelix vancouverensis]